jgi:hypothetical protein
MAYGLFGTVPTSSNVAFFVQVGELATGWIFSQRTIELCGHQLLSRGAIRLVSRLLSK